MSRNEQLTLTAMIVWETLLEADPGTYPGYEKYRYANGVCETRDRVVSIAAAVEEVWSMISYEEFDAPFDWEFVPLFLEHCTDGIEVTIPRYLYKQAAEALCDIQRADDLDSRARANLKTMRALST